MKICIYGASKENIDRIYIEKSYEFGALLAKRGHTMIFGGGATGLMGAAARGIMDNNGDIIGIAPKYFDRPLWLYYIYRYNIRKKEFIN